MMRNENANGEIFDTREIKVYVLSVTAPEVI